MGAISLTSNGSKRRVISSAHGFQRKTDPEKDWAKAPRYLNVVRCNGQGGIGGNPTDFPIFNELPDEQVLRAFVLAASAITGCVLVEKGDA